MDAYQRQPHRVFGWSLNPPPSISRSCLPDSCAMPYICYIWLKSCCMPATLTVFDNASGRRLPSYSPMPHNNKPQLQCRPQTQCQSQWWWSAVCVCVCCSGHLPLCQMLRIAGGTGIGIGIGRLASWGLPPKCRAINRNLPKSRRCPHPVMGGAEVHRGVCVQRIAGDIRVKTMYALEVI